MVRQVHDACPIKLSFRIYSYHDFTVAGLYLDFLMLRVFNIRYWKPSTMLALNLFIINDRYESRPILPR